MHFFNPDKNGEKFKCQLPIKADPTSKARRKTTAESIPIEAEENKCSSDIGKITQGKGAFIVLLQFNLLYFSPTRHLITETQVSRDRGWLTPSRFDS